MLAWLERVGELPLPPYIRRPGGPTPADRERYQTTFARVPGAVAAPTAGLHFTPALLAALADAGIAHVTLTLARRTGHLPADPRRRPRPATAWRPSASSCPRADRGRASSRRAAAGGRVVAVGTTTVRALESAAAGGSLRAGARRRRAVHPARARVPGRRRAAHQLPPAAHAAARAGRCASPGADAVARRLRRGGAPALPLLQLRRRDADHVTRARASRCSQPATDGARLGRLTLAHGVGGDAGVHAGGDARAR